MSSNFIQHTRETHVGWGKDVEKTMRQKSLFLRKERKDIYENEIDMICQWLMWKPNSKVLQILKESI
jgi:phosphatidylserine/phosphatidylglycerophosphate/cardiolipin synthase-like enzyme